jgi:hypothetical protein
MCKGREMQGNIEMYIISIGIRLISTPEFTLDRPRNEIAGLTCRIISRFMFPHQHISYPACELSEGPAGCVDLVPLTGECECGLC